MDRDHILGLAPRKLARILGLTLAGDREDQTLGENGVAELLDRCLHARVPDKGNQELTWSGFLENLKADSEIPDGIVLVGLLTNSMSSLKTVKAVRKCAKQRAARNVMDPEYSVAITLYFAAIAHALVFHGAKITTYSYSALETSFNRLVSKPWMPEELGILLARAGDYCRTRS